MASNDEVFFRTRFDAVVGAFRGANANQGARARLVHIINFMVDSLTDAVVAFFAAGAQLMASKEGVTLPAAMISSDCDGHDDFP